MSSFELPLWARLRVRENQIFLLLTILISVLAGLAAVLFTLAIKGTTRVLFGTSPTAARYILVPTVVSFFTGFLLKRFFPDARGSGVPQTEAAYHLQQGVIPGRTAFGKFVTGALCIGCGHSMGREGPSVQVGAGIASSIGRWFHLSPERVQSLVPVASAAALSAAFNTPVAAVLFALEEIVGDMNAALIGSTVLASVTAVVVERSILGNNPIFHVPAYQLVHPAELIVYAALGILGGIVSLAFSKGLLRLRAFFLRLPKWSTLFQPAIGGVIIGIILIFFPQVLGVGYEYVDQALNNELLLKTMIVLCGMKLVATIISYASGNAGGIFSPSLYLGAMAGGAVGIVVHRFAPFPVANSGAYALVGMGTTFAGIIRAPMTSVFMIFELTQDYQIVVPLMIANMISFAISKRFQPVALYHALLHQDHVYLPDLRTRMPAIWRARDIMLPSTALIPPDTTIAEACKIVASQDESAFMLGRDGLSSGIVTRARMEEAMRTGLAGAPVCKISTDDYLYLYPDQPLDLVIERLGRSPGVLPVVSRRDIHLVEGVITSQRLFQFLQTNLKDSTVATEAVTTTSEQDIREKPAA